MSWKTFYRQRAERFAQLLDEANGGRRHHIRSRVDDDLAQPLAIGQRLRDARSTVEVDPDFRAGLRAMLVATAEREGIGATATDDAIVDGGGQPATRRTGQPAFRGPRTRARARGAVVIGVAVGAIAVSGMSAASENAVPGDALYGMKRHTERAQLALASSDLSRGQLFLDFARTRLAEAVAVGGQNFGFSAVLDDMDADTRQGIKLLTSASAQRRDPAALDAVDSFLRQQRPQVVRLFEDTTRATRSRANDSLVLLDAVQNRADSLRAALACGAGATGRADSIGPLPRACPVTRGSTSTPPDTSTPTVEGDSGSRTEAEPPRTPTERTPAPRDPAPTPSQEQPPPVRDRTTSEPVHRVGG
ncbi:hypothetical protein Pen02_04500 [Plantactinospora endophytica]|uniref:DUF5667 domain-containing protein n=1 Tax=Plantactinospora endophytica TaxID=673535 RepID=A0ABQ4DSU6_9ACTN|nr:hypothetical protein Pen02_04500 [Plantactinospora endophytica]